MAGEQRVIYTLLIYNNPTDSDFTISKQVKGNFGSKTKDFNATVYLEDSTGKPYVGSFYMKKNSEKEEKINLSASNGGTVRLQLSDGDTYVFTGLAENTTFKVTEVPEGYTSEGYLDGVLKSTSGTVSGNTSTGHHVLFVNTLNGIIPTGIENTYHRGACILCAIVSGALAVRIYFKTRREEEYEE